MSNLSRSVFQGHSFHLVSLSPWPILTCVSLLNLTTLGGLSMGVSLFTISKALFFLAMFWSYFYSVLSPTAELGAQWPPMGMGGAILYRHFVDVVWPPSFMSVYSSVYQFTYCTAVVCLNYISYVIISTCSTISVIIYYIVYSISMRHYLLLFHVVIIIKIT